MTQRIDNAARTLEEADREIEALRARLAIHEGNGTEPIAIVGIGCRFPGGANSAETFWELLLSGIDAIGPIPADRGEMGAAPDSTFNGNGHSRDGAFLENVSGFDHDFFGIAPSEAIHMDPQQRLLLETSWEALEHAGIAADQLRGSKTGVFVGAIYADYLIRQLREGGLENINAYYGTGNTLSAMAGRLSYHFGFRGPSIAVDTACSTSLVTVHMACTAIRNGECDMALAGGVNLILTPEPMINVAKARMMSPSGRCRTFDAGADGYVRGEGAGVVVLKRLSQAQAAGDRILGLIRGSAVNHDGRSNGLTAPSRQAQAALLREAAEAAGVEPSAVGYIECHGTGTPLGDPIEVGAIVDAFLEGRDSAKPLLLGAVKTNYGHLEGAAGICGLIKTALVLRHGEIPANLHFEKLNPYIRATGRPLLFPHERVAWIREDEARIGGVSSFGLLGTNAHVVLQAFDGAERATQESGEQRILALSARTLAALKVMIEDYLEITTVRPDVSLADLCHTANAGRSHFEQRFYATGNSVAQLRENLRARLHELTHSTARSGISSTTKPKVAFLFTGQGSQYAGMGNSLYSAEPAFRSALDRCSEILGPIGGHELISVIHGESDGQLGQTAFTQPALFALAYSLCELLASWGIQPAVVLGHSVGEYVAACRAGIFSLEDGLRLCAARGRLMQALPLNGGMAAVRAPQHVVEEALRSYPDTLALAALNAPSEVVISGRKDHLDAALAKLAADGYNARTLQVSHAFHSPLMRPLMAEFERVLNTVTFYPAECAILSNVTGREAAEEEMSCAAYWLEHVLAPVQFESSVRTLETQGCDFLLEVGPQRVLANLVSRILPDASWKVASSLQPGSDDIARMLSALGELYASGCSVTWAEVERNRPGRTITLPTYPFQRRKIWFEIAPEQAVLQRARRALPAPKPAMAEPSTKLRFSLMFFAATQKVSDTDKYRLVLDAARFGDANDFHSVWVPERHFSDMGSLYPNAAVLHAALARETVNIRLMAGSVVVPLHHPVRIAEEWAMVDNLSNGRVGISFASGWNPNDFALAPGNYEGRRELLYSGADMVRRLWRGEHVEVSNGVGSKIEVSVLPTPIQKELPFWLTAAGAPISFQKAGELGANLLTHLLDQDVEDLAEKIRLYRESRALHGHDPAAGIVTIMVHTSVGADAEATRQAIKQPFCEYLKASRNLLSGLAQSRGQEINIDSLSEPDLDQLTAFLFERFSKTRALIGSPESCQPLLRSLADAGVNEIASLLDFGQSPEASLAGLPWLNQLRLQGANIEVATAKPTDKGAGAVRPKAALAADAYYEVDWRPLAQAPVEHQQATGRWLIFADASNLANHLAELLGADRAVIIRKGIRFPDFETNEFWLPDLSMNGVAAVLGVTEMDYPAVEGVVYLWPLDANSAGDETAESLMSCQSLVVEGARQMLQTLAELLPEKGLALHWVTQGAVLLPGDGHKLSLGQSTLSGFARVLRHEYPQWTSAQFDLDPAGTSEANSHVLFTLLHASKGEDRIALRGGRAFGERMVRSEAQIGAAPVHRCNPNGGYLITGGLGGVGLKMAEWLAAQGVKELLLLGRSEPRLAARQCIEAIEAQGTRVTVAQADISGEASLADAIQSWKLRTGGVAIRGVMHTAGIWQDSRIANMDAASLAKVLLPKVAGVWNLERVLGNEPLDLFVSFSSLSSLLPANGQANYAAANAFLDAHARWRKAQGKPALSINWGPWSEVGFGATEAGLRAHERLETFGMFRISPDEGLSALETLLARDTGMAAVAKVDWHKLCQVDPELARLPMLSELTERAHANATAHSAGLPALLQKAWTGKAPELEMVRDLVLRIVAKVLRHP